MVRLLEKEKRANRWFAYWKKKNKPKKGNTADEIHVC